MSKKTKRPSEARAQHPKPRLSGVRPRWMRTAGAVVVVLAIGAVLTATQFKGGSSKKASAGLPNTSDYHSLLVSPSNARDLLLGTHQGLYESVDGGLTWRFASLSGDAMNLARPKGKTVWLAGHNVFKKSLDGGLSWQDLRPFGLPSLDLHGFTVDPVQPKNLYAAVAGQGLYRSIDGGRSFALASSEVGGNVMALAATTDGRLLAGDMQTGLQESSDGGTSWRRVFDAQVMGLAISPSNPQRVLATGRGVARSVDGGRTWKIVFDLSEGSGPVAWSTSVPRLAYAVGFNRKLYRSSDAGESWEEVR